MRRSAMTLLLVAGAALLAAPAAAQESYPPLGLALEVSDAELACPGDEFTLTGTDFIAGSVGGPVTVAFDGTTVATVTPDESGSFAVTVTAPDAAGGAHQVTATQSFTVPDTGERVTIQATATVTCVVAAEQLAVTGGNISLGLVLLAALLVIGTAAVWAGRRRAAA